VTEQAEVAVIGMGPGGEEVAGRLAQAGLDVIGIEKLLLGGECPYWGCIPSKMMIRAADLLAEGRRIAGMAGESTVRPGWAPVAKRIREEATDDWDDKVAVDRFVGKGGRFLRGEGRLVGPGRVAVGETEIEVSRAIVLGTGSAAAVPPIAGLDGVDYWINRDAIETEEVPESLVVLGGGAIGVELAQVFGRFGSRITVVEAMDRILAMEEPEASALIEEVFRREGIEVRTGTSAVEVAQDGNSIAVTLQDGAVVTGERLLVATGRRANLAALGVGAIGIDEGQRWVPVDERMRVVPGVWAVGDLTGKGLFTHIAMYQASIAIADILGRPGPPADYTALPRVTFTDPEVGAVGLTEQAARAAGRQVRAVSTPLPQSTRGWIHKAGNDGFIKLVEDLDAGVLVGATSAGPNGGEVLGFLALAVHARVPVTQLRSMIYAYPTFHRAIEATLAALEDVSPGSFGGLPSATGPGRSPG
jgi:pyruvate/2-oxoglutarate dehydrogenase complex dihydrolipoamide dehydrogenase (E3) component